jgi:diguanylate cyclase (GGDEF)-like protein
MRDGINTREQLLAEVDALRSRVKDLEARCARVEEDTVRKSEEKYRLLFHSTPIALLERDASRLKTYLDLLRESGIADFEAYLRDNRQETAHCMSMIKTVEFNNAFLKLLEVDTRDQLESGFPFIGSPEEFHRLVLEIIPMIAERNISREREITLVTGKGNKRSVLTKALIVSGSEDTLARIVIAMVDITQRKEAEESLRVSEQRFREQAMRDNLTGLYNRRYLYNSLTGLIETSRATQSSLSVIFMDLDNFKKVVDTYGHLNGSRAIQEVARTIHENVDAPAYAVAYAGDEFVIVLPGFNSFQAVEKASNLQSRIKSAVYLLDYGHEVKLQASYGIAAFPDHATDLTGLLASADRALFSVKEKGRGGVGLADRLTSFEDLFNQ